MILFLYVLFVSEGNFIVSIYFANNITARLMFSSTVAAEQSLLYVNILSYTSLGCHGDQAAMEFAKDQNSLRST